MEHIKNEFYIRPEDANRIWKKCLSKNLGITFDAAHVPLDINVMDYITRMDKVMHIHLSDLTPRKNDTSL